MESIIRELLKGETHTITVKFRRNGSPVSFSQAPKWNLMNSQDEIILTGVTQAGSGNTWNVQLTVPADYELLTNPTEEMNLEIYGKDVKNIERSIDYPVLIADFADDFIAEGLVWYKGQELLDSIITTGEVTAVTSRIENAAGTVAFADSDIDVDVGTSMKVRARSDVPDRFRSQPINTQYRTDLNLGEIELPESSAPYLLIHTVTTDAGVETIAHQLYWTNNRILNNVIRQKNYLDKARLTEIDPTMQWWDNELVAAAYEGISYINGHPTEVTYWKASDMPISLDTYWFYAACLHSLNTRYLAEGMTAFEFTGLNTTLTSDRRESLSYKIEELRTYLDKLEAAKKAAIRAFGKGATDPTATTSPGRGAIAALGLTVSPVNNAVRMRTWNRAQRFRSFM